MARKLTLTYRSNYKNFYAFLEIRLFWRNTVLDIEAPNIINYVLFANLYPIGG